MLITILVKKEFKFEEIFTSHGFNIGLEDIFQRKDSR